MRRLLLIRHATTPTTRRAGFPATSGRAHEQAGEEPDEAGLAEATRLAPHVPRATRCWSSHAARTIATARALGLEPDRMTDDLADAGYGRWAGRSLASVQGLDPTGLAAWLVDPRHAPHEGETQDHVRARARRVLACAQPLEDTTVVVTHGRFIVAVVQEVLGLASAPLWRLDIAPTSVTEVRPSRRGWRLARMNWTYAPASWHAGQRRAQQPVDDSISVDD